MIAVAGERDRAPIVLAAGGTGGHMFPAAALAHELTARGRRVLLVTDARGVRYADGFPAEDILEISAGSVSAGGPIARLAGAAALLAGTWRAYGFLGRYRPAAVIGFGGYPSFPALGAAWLRGIAFGLHEQNAILGRVNRLFAGRASLIATATAKVRGLPRGAEGRTVVVGTPVRPEVLTARDTPYQAPGAEGDIRLLVFGGSQGASILAEVVPAAIALLPDLLRVRLVVTQQARPVEVDGVRNAYRAAGVRAEVAPFLSDMGTRLAGTHLVIARAGATTIAELTVVGRPAVLVPLPNALDDQQTVNADAIAQSGGAWHLPQAELTPRRLARVLDDLLTSPDVLTEVASTARGAGRPRAAGILADAVETLANTRDGIARGQVPAREAHP